MRSLLEKFKFKIPIFKITWSSGQKPKITAPIVSAAKKAKEIITQKKKTPMINQLRDLFVAKMLAYEGKKETDGKNRAPWIDQDNKRAGVALGSPYCLTSALCRLDEACVELKLKNPVGIHASTQRFYAKSPEHYRFQFAKKGMIGIQQSRKDKTKGHATPVRENMIADSKYYRSIEFNTDGSGSRDGDGVWKKTRSLDGDSSKIFLGFVDVCQWVMDHNTEQQKGN